MCPWRVNEAEPTMITSCHIFDMGEYDIPHSNGNLYQKNITGSVIFTWSHAHNPSGAVAQSTPAANTKPKRAITEYFHLSLLSSWIRLFDVLLSVVFVQ